MGLENFGMVKWSKNPSVRLSGWSGSPKGEVLKLNGVGFKSFHQSGWLVCGVGYSHYVGLATPGSGHQVRSRRGGVSLGGGLAALAGRVQDLRRPDPYKGRGIYSVTHGKPPTKPGKRR